MILQSLCCCFLHGGPGVCNRHTIIKDHADLLDTFTVVAWDQRGSGGSYFGVKESDLTVKQLVEDAAALVEYLCKRFNKDKIFVIGGSWGSGWGLTSPTRTRSISPRSSASVRSSTAR